MKVMELILGVILLFVNLYSQTADAPSGSGTSGSPYQIATWQNLYWISQNSSSWDKYFVQTADINLGNASPAINTWDSNKGWTPIGNMTTKFTGSYNGQNHIINGLYINRNSSSKNEQGLFGAVKNATITNLGLTNVNITAAGEYVYSEMFGWTWNGGSYVGALAGWVASDGGSTSITNCFTKGTVTGGSAVGGFIGQIWVYSNTCTISNSYSTVAVTGREKTGGFVGTNRGTISNCYSKGDVTRTAGESYTNFGAFVGYHWTGTTQNCYTTGNVYYEGATAPTTKGFVAITYESNTFSNNFWDSEASNQSSATGATDKTTVQMKTQTTFTNAGWDFTNTWAISSGLNDGYPYLQWAIGADQSLPVELTNFTAEHRSGVVLLSWTTESETENLGFIIERKTVGANHDLPSEWSQIASYVTDEMLTGHGSTSEKHEYQYTDKAVQPGATYLYRLADVDYGGKVTWHKEVEVKVEFQNVQMPLVFGLQPAYPNPFNPALTIPYGLTEDGQMTLKVYNLRGELVKVLKNTYALKGTYAVTWQPLNLSAGIYFIQLQSGNKTNLQKVVFVK